MVKSGVILKKIRVCIFSTAQPVNDVRLFYREAKSLAKEGYDVHVILAGAKDEFREGVHVHGVTKADSRLVRMFILPWVVVFKALRTKSCIYHFHDPELLPLGFLMKWLLFKRVIFDMRESTRRQIMGKEYISFFFRRAASLSYQLLEWLCLKGLFLIVANDLSALEYKKSYLVRNFPEIGENNLISNFVPMSQRLKKPLIIYLGGVWESRGGSTYVDIANRLNEDGLDFEMMIIGPYTESYGKYLKAKVDQLKLGDKIKITGRMDYNAAMKYVSRAAIGLSILDPIPNYTFCLSGKILEYMMVGTPVLCSDFIHWMSYVDGEKAGRGVDPANMDEIYKVCRSMLSDKEVLDEMSHNGIEAVQKKYNWETEFKVLVACYKDILAR